MVWWIILLNLNVSSAANRAAETFCDPAEARIQALKSHKKNPSSVLKEFSKKWKIKPKSYSFEDVIKALRSHLEGPKDLINLYQFRTTPWTKTMTADEKIRLEKTIEGLIDLAQVADRLWATPATEDLMRERIQLIKFHLKATITEKSKPSKARDGMLKAIESIKYASPTAMSQSRDLAERVEWVNQYLNECGFSTGYSDLKAALGVKTLYPKPKKEVSRYLIVCPALLQFGALSPIGLSSLSHLLAHEIAHAVDGLPWIYSDFEEKGYIADNSLRAFYRPLNQCWDNTLKAFVPTLNQVHENLLRASSRSNQSAAIDLLDKVVVRYISILGRPPKDFEIRSFEMIADYWATETLSRMYRLTPTTNKNEIFLKENFLFYCSFDRKKKSSDEDDGMHLPETFRLQWILGHPDLKGLKSGALNSTALFPWCSL
jgi:hypothetical protein